MAKPRFTNEQIAEILQQSKEGASNKELCEHYQFSVSTLRRWQEQHADGISLCGDRSSTSAASPGSQWAVRPPMIFRMEFSIQPLRTSNTGIG